jgi:hypothetical protein
MAMENRSIRAVICNRIASGVRKYMKNIEDTAIRMPEIMQTSQVGAINLMLHHGRIIIGD